MLQYISSYKDKANQHAASGAASSRSAAACLQMQNGLLQSECHKHYASKQHHKQCATAIAGAHCELTPSVFAVWFSRHARPSRPVSSVANIPLCPFHQHAKATLPCQPASQQTEVLSLCDIGRHAAATYYVSSMASVSCIQQTQGHSVPSTNQHHSQ